MLLRTLTLILLSFITISSAAVTLTEFYYDNPQYFIADSFDTINSDNFRQKNFGSFQYSLGGWFKVSRSIPTTDNAMLMHLTALDVDFPWNGVSYPSSTRHLASLIRLRYIGSNNNLQFAVASFTNYENVQTNGYGLASDCWHYVYVGVDHIVGTSTVGVFSDGCQPNAYWTTLTLGGSYSNEALDARLVLHLGGSKNHIPSKKPNTQSWPGSLYKVLFLNGFFANSQSDARIVMQGERRNMYFFFLDNKVFSQILPSYSDPNTYITMGSSKAVEATDPAANGVNGLTLADATSKKMFITLSKELGEFNFISFRVRVDTPTPASATHTIMSVMTPSGSEFLSIVYKQATGDITLQRGAASISGTFTVTPGAWHFVFLTFNYHPIDSTSEIVTSLMIDKTQVMKNSRIVGSTLPIDYIDPHFIVHFGKMYSGTSSINGAIRNIIGGLGTYFLHDPLSTTCTLSVGLENPYCLLCDSTSALYVDTEGKCKTECPAGTYKDANSLVCVRCDQTCATCDGAGPQSCTSCTNDIPLFFRSICFKSCPTGTTKAADGTCVCDSTCSGCLYNSATNSAECITCSQTSLFLAPDKLMCVPALDCPLGTFADASTQTCATTCPMGKVKDYANRKCADFCPTNTYKVTGPPVTCQAVCPDTTYGITIVPGVAGETTKGCQACTAPCLTCKSATDCLSCVSPNFLHEDTYRCHAACQAGFKFELPNYFCKACRKGCASCSPLLLKVPADNSCVDTCPIGTAAVAGVCQIITGVDATILNKTVSVPIISISRKENLVLLGDYYSSGAVATLEWTLDTTDLALKELFFNGVLTNFKEIVVPTANLKPSTTYKVVFTVTDTSGNTDNEFVMLKTDSAIVPGTFKVSPTEGKAFETEFSFEISGFSTTSSLKFDIISYFDRTHYVGDSKYIEQVEALSIVLGGSQATYKLIYPVSKYTIPLTVQLCAYNDHEQYCTTRSIKVNSSGSPPLQKVLVWGADASTYKDIGQMLDFVRSISLFYTRGYGNQISTEYYRGALLFENLIFTKDLVPCSKIAECSNGGQCVPDGNSFTCDCESGQGGYNCYYGEREYDQITTRVKDILNNLYSVKLDISNVEKAILILNELTNSLDFIEYNSIFFFRDVLTNILKVPNLRKHHFRYIFNVVGEMIGFIKRPLTGTWFKAMDRSLLLNNFTALAETTFKKIDGIWSPDNYFVVDTNFLKIMMLSGTPVDFLGNPEASSLIKDWELFGYTIPRELLVTRPKSTVKLLGYKINPYNDAQNNNQITSVMIVEIHSIYGLVSVSNSAKQIELRIPKLTATPIFEPKPQKIPYNCQYKTSIDRAKINFKQDGCSFVKETETHLVCQCNHLTEFVGQLDLDNILVFPSIQSIMAMTTKFIADQIEYEDKKRRFMPDEPEPEDPVITAAPEEKIIRKFYFPNVGFYISISIIFFYLVGILLNYKHVHENALKKFLDYGQSVLVLTYHPVLSMFIRAHTKTSNTQLMRISKFFCMMQLYAGYTSAFYFFFDIQTGIGSGGKLILSAIITIFLTSGSTYAFEKIYAYIRDKKHQGRRTPKLYHKIHIGIMIFWLVAITVLVGFIRRPYKQSWVGSFILAAAFDLLVLDFLVLFFAVVKKNNSKSLKMFRVRGYYVDTGAASIITLEDETKLLRKINAVLKIEPERVKLKIKVIESPPQKTEEKLPNLQDHDETGIHLASPPTVVPFSGSPQIESPDEVQDLDFNETERRTLKGRGEPDLRFAGNSNRNTKQNKPADKSLIKSPKNPPKKTTYSERIRASRIQRPSQIKLNGSKDVISKEEVPTPAELNLLVTNIENAVQKPSPQNKRSDFLSNRSSNRGVRPSLPNTDKN